MRSSRSRPARCRPAHNPNVCPRDRGNLNTTGSVKGLGTMPGMGVGGGGGACQEVFAKGLAGRYSIFGGERAGAYE